MSLRINNKEARWLWLQSQGLARPPMGALDLLQIIKDLGFVQLDSIRNVTRAHHHILWSRNQNYREPMLWDLLAEGGALFEHFTHDASLIPMEFYPVWTRQFSRLKKKLKGSWYTGSPLSLEAHEAIKARIQREGPLCTRAFDTKISGKKAMWTRPPHKKALDYMWYCGELTTSHRENFIKFYDLTHRVIPKIVLEDCLTEHTQIETLCHAAIDRLAFGTLADIQRFWAATDRAEVRDWAAHSKSLIPVEIESYEGHWMPAYGCSDIEERLRNVTAPTARLRVVNPFDPAIRDRLRLKRLFGMDYKIEIFVPKSKRQYGYYVYPMLEGDRFIGRVELKADRKKSVLSVHNIWLESNVKWTQGRETRFNSELSRLGRFIGVREIFSECKI